jgi:hypothetical protein
VFKRYLHIATAAAVLAAAGPAAAQSVGSPYDFVRTSHGLHAYATYVFTDRGTIGTGPHSAPALGLGYGIRISGPFAFDSRIAFMPTSRTVFTVDPEADPDAVREDPTVGLEEIGTADLSLLLADVSLRFNITGPRTWNNLQPYALLGAGAVVGLAADHAAEEGLPEDADLRVRFSNGVTGHFGGGVEWHIADRFTIRFDARDVLWRLHVPTGFITTARVIDDRQWVQTAHLSIGAGYRF